MTRLDATDRFPSTLPLIAAAALSTTLLLGCGDADEEPGAPAPYTLTFAAMVGDDAFECGKTYSGLGSASSDLAFVDLRAYISQIELLKADGSAVPFELVDDDSWQTSEVAMLDFEDGCSNGNSNMNTEVYGLAPQADYTGVRFALGVPPKMNDAAMGLEQRNSPLNVSAMYWSWTTGYKFLRIDSPGDFRMHLGATGCDGGHSGHGGGDVPTGETSGHHQCDTMNQPTVELSGFTPGSSTIALDLAELVKGVDVSSEGSACFSEPDSAACAAMFEVIGLGSGDQSFFSVR